MDFTASRLLEVLSDYPPATAYVVAFSGGLDSHLLLHSLAEARARLPGQLRAVHVDHGLSVRSAEWSGHCLAVCDALGIPCTAIRVDAAAPDGESPEAAARRARYGALRDLLGPGELLLTAHHRDDQAETVLLQLLRGAGVRGLSAMPALTPFGRGRLARPLLGFGRASLRRAAEAAGLDWIEDPSNFDTGFDRNYLRHEIVPRLLERWPGALDTLCRSASHMADAQRLLDVLAGRDTADIERPDGTLSSAGLAALPPDRAGNLLRYWLRSRGLPLPDSRRLERILQDVVGARLDASPRVCWDGAEVRRHRDALYAMKPLADPPAQPLPWDLVSPLAIPGLGELRPGRNGRGLPADTAQPVSVRFRRGGERCRIRAGGPRRDLKKLFQEAGVPPWVRERTPLVYIGDELAAVAGFWLCEPFAVDGGITPCWQSASDPDESPPAVETACENNEN